MIGRPISNRKKSEYPHSLDDTRMGHANASAPMGARRATPAEQFVPRSAQVTGGAIVELRSEAAIAGEDVRLRQVCRWADSDATAMTPLSDLTIAHLKGTAPFNRFRWMKSDRRCATPG